MCELVTFSDKDLKEIRQLYPKELPKDYYSVYIFMIKEHVKKNKENHMVEKSTVLGMGEGEHEIITGTLMDAIEVRPKFMSAFTVHNMNP